MRPNASAFVTRPHPIQPPRSREAGLAAFQKGASVLIVKAKTPRVHALPNLAGALMDVCPEVHGALCLAGTDFVLRRREIVDGFHPPLQSPRSARQDKCLLWVRGGKTGVEIGVLLGMSSRTFHNHLEKAKARLNTPKRPPGVEGVGKERAHLSFRRLAGVSPAVPRRAPRGSWPALR